ncbi:GNAT family N-acetyltransferase, partial [Rhizobium ruizarguesonis]
YDAVCDHLLVLDRSIDGHPEDQIVCTYRLLRQDVAIANGGFYSASEFEIDCLIAKHPDKRFMELDGALGAVFRQHARAAELH